MILAPALWKFGTHQSTVTMPVAAGAAWVPDACAPDVGCTCAAGCVVAGAAWLQAARSGSDATPRAMPARLRNWRRVWPPDCESNAVNEAGSERYVIGLLQSVLAPPCVGEGCLRAPCAACNCGRQTIAGSHQAPFPTDP